MIRHPSSLPLSSTLKKEGRRQVEREMENRAEWKTRQTLKKKAHLFVLRGTRNPERGDVISEFTVKTYGTRYEQKPRERRPLACLRLCSKKRLESHTATYQSSERVSCRKRREFEDFETRSGVEAMEPNPSGDNAQDPRLGDNNSTSRRQKRKGRGFHRHTEHQVQELEAFFNECPNPNAKQRKDMSQKLGLEPWQIKFWYQNKRTRTKAQHEHHENEFLKAENEKLWADVLATTTCHNCGGRTAFTELYFDNRQLRNENARLKDRLAKISAIVTKNDEEPLVSDNPHIPPPLPFHPSNQFPTQSDLVEETQGRIDLIGSTSAPSERRDMHHHEWSDLEDELAAMINQFDPGETPRL